MKLFSAIIIGVILGVVTLLFPQESSASGLLTGIAIGIPSPMEVEPATVYHPPARENGPPPVYGPTGLILVSSQHYTTSHQDSYSGRHKQKQHHDDGDDDDDDDDHHDDDHHDDDHHDDDHHDDD
jgi:hypothetical protein